LKNLKNLSRSPKGVKNVKMENMDFENKLVYQYMPSYYNKLTKKERIFFKFLFDDPNNVYVKAVRDFNYGSLTIEQIKNCIKIANTQDNFLQKLNKKYTKN